MNACELIGELRSAGYVLRAVAGQIRIKGKGPSCPDDVRAKILALREEVLQVLEDEAEADTVNAAPPPVDEPEPSPAGQPDIRTVDDPMHALPVDQLASMPRDTLLVRLHKTACRIAALIAQGDGDGEESQELTAERQFIELHRPDDWRLLTAGRTAPPLARLDRPVLGKPTPLEHLASLGGFVALAAIDLVSAHRLWSMAQLWARDGPDSRWAVEYWHAWAVATSAEPEMSTNVYILQQRGRR